MTPVLGVHGIWNLERELTSVQAGAELADRWGTALAAGYRAAGQDGPVPRIAAVYYADLLADGAQGAGDDLEHLTPQEKEWAWAWMVQLGVPQEAAQGGLTRPLRQGLDWLARRDNMPGRRFLARVMAAVLREVFVYVSRPGVRQRVRRTVVAALEQHRPSVVLAHSLGSVVAYEALHARPDLPVELLVTLGSPLGMPEVVFEALDPEPVAGRGRRPASVANWVNIADVGDVVAVPVELGGRFDVDLHREVRIGAIDCHSMGGYLADRTTAMAVARYV